MDQQTLYILIGVAAVVVIALIVLAVMAAGRRKSERDDLRQRFGSEYDRTVKAKGGEKAAVAELRDRERAHEGLSLRDTGDAERDELRARMAALQFGFVDDPNEVLLETQRVALDALRLRGYPVAENRDEGLRLLSVDHPEETGPIRDLLGGSYGTDVGRMRRLFLDTRHALATIIGISYSLRDAADGLHAADTAGLTAGASRRSALDGPPSAEPIGAGAPVTSSSSQVDGRESERHHVAAGSDPDRQDTPAHEPETPVHEPERPEPERPEPERPEPEPETPVHEPERPEPEPAVPEPERESAAFVPADDPRVVGAEQTEDDRVSDAPPEPPPPHTEPAPITRDADSPPAVVPPPPGEHPQDRRDT